jgi:two-component system, NtrC family, sensor histidine kinase KinB
LASTDFSLKLLEDNRIGQLSDEQKELVQQLKNDNQRMLKILSELLNMSQVDAGKIQLKIAPVKLEDIIESSLIAVSSSIKQNNISITQNIEPLPQINLDGDKVGWVITNLLTNAIRFSPPAGTIIISTKNTNNVLTLSVQDQGPGIDRMYFDKVFERFFKIPGQSKNQGSGIGLAICKELITAMGGKIWLKSELNKGSEFGFDLPLLFQ